MVRWSAYAVLGIALTLGGVAKGRQQHEAVHSSGAATAYDGGHAAAAPAPTRSYVYQPSCNAPPSREDAEYCAAREAADAERQSAQWAYIELWIAGLGVVAVVVTLIFTRNAAAAAAKAAGVAEDAFLKLERPYVFIHGIHGVEALPQDGYKPRILYSVSNNGRLAARIKHVYVRFGPVLNGVYPEKDSQLMHILYADPIMSADETRRRIIYELGKSPLITRGDITKPDRVEYEIADGAIFQVIIEYQGPSGRETYETGVCWQYLSDRTWLDDANPDYTYMK